MPQSRRLFGSVLSAAVLVWGGVAVAQTPAQPERAEIMNRLVGCRSIADSAQRLACFDTESAAVDAAERSGALVVVDQGQIRQARRAMFGFSMPSLAMFERGDQAERVENLTTTLTRASQVGAGDWRFVLEDGSVWLQTDNEYLSRPTPGAPVVVRRGALGSYLLSVNGARSLRVTRQQ